MLDHPQAEPDPCYEKQGHEKRRHTRHSVAWPANCFAAGGERFEALIVNVSEGGFGLTGAAPTLGVESILYIDFDQICTFRCRVAWSHENRFGVEIIDDQLGDETGQVFSLADALQSLKKKR